VSTDETATTDPPASIEEFDDLVEWEPRLLVELYTTGCTIFRSMEPVLGNVARASDATVALVDLAEVPVVERYDVASVPTLFLFESGGLVARRADGFLGTDEVLAFLDQ
jgi:thioredoxin-like negative regulator of GroEL